jgi:hypothetical protein
MFGKITIAETVSRGHEKDREPFIERWGIGTFISNI